MDPLGTSVATMSSSAPLSIFTSNRNTLLRKSSILPITKINSGNESDADLNPDSDCTNLVPLLNNRISFSPLSKDAAMGLILSAATGRGWTTGSGMEGPSVPAGANLDSGSGRVSTFPWSLFTRSPRRRMRVSFTCNICGQRTTRAINPHAYTDGTVFVQCCGCNVFHKLVDNLNLFHEMKCYVNPKFNYRDPKGDLPFNYTDMDDDFSIF